MKRAPVKGLLMDDSRQLDHDLLRGVRNSR